MKKRTGSLVPLSPQNLVDCSTTDGNHGCRGGYISKAYSYIIRNGGVDSWSFYPYEHQVILRTTTSCLSLFPYSLPSFFYFPTSFFTSLLLSFLPCVLLSILVPFFLYCLFYLLTSIFTPFTALLVSLLPYFLLPYLNKQTQRNKQNKSLLVFCL